LKVRDLVTLASICILLISVAGVEWSIDVFLNHSKYFPRWVGVDGLVAAIMPPIVDPVKVTVAVFSVIGVIESIVLYLLFRNDYDEIKLF
jgi:hypothetical protein